MLCFAGGATLVSTDDGKDEPRTAFRPDWWDSSDAEHPDKPLFKALGRSRIDHLRKERDPTFKDLDDLSNDVVHAEQLDSEAFDAHGLYPCVAVLVQLLMLPKHAPADVEPTDVEGHSEYTSASPASSSYTTASTTSSDIYVDGNSSCCALGVERCCEKSTAATDGARETSAASRVVPAAPPPTLFFETPPRRSERNGSLVPICRFPDATDDCKYLLSKPAKLGEHGVQSGKKVVPFQDTPVSRRVARLLLARFASCVSHAAARIHVLACTACDHQGRSVW